MTTPIVDQATATFEADGASVSRARRFVRDALARWEVESVVDDAVLLVSELVTNAIVHAGTLTDVTCTLTPEGLQVDVVDRYPGRWLPAGPVPADDESEGGRGLALAAELASTWGVAYTRTTKRVWFVLPLRGDGRGATELATPLAAAAASPEPLGDVIVAELRLSSTGHVAAWSHDATELLGWAGAEVVGRHWGELVVWPRGTGALPVDDLVTLARWQGAYGVRHSSGHAVRLFASHVATGSAGGHDVVCLLVREEHRSMLAAPVQRALQRSTDRESEDDVGLSDALAVRLELDELLQRTVERARDILLGDAAYALLFTEGTDEVELRATTGLPANMPRYLRFPVEHGVGARLSSERLPTVLIDVEDEPAAPTILRGSGLRSLVTVPLLVEGRAVGTLAVASRAAGRFDNDAAVRLQRAADRVALAVQTARLVELERSRRGWLSFVAEASDLLAGTLDLDMALALVGQLVVPRLGVWCAVYISDELGVPRLASVWHADEAMGDDLRRLLEKAPAPRVHEGRGAVSWVPGAGLTIEGTELASAAALATDTALAVPLLARGRTLGTLALGRPAGETFRRDVTDLAEDLARRAALALDNARLYSERTATAQALQRSLLPPELPEIAGLDAGAVYQAAGAGNEAGGDFYDLFDAGQDRWGFAIGDVCGKGPDAAAVTGLARQALRILGREAMPVPDMLDRLNTAILAEGSRSRFLTVVVGHIEALAVGGLRLSLVCAGHPQPVVVRADGSVALVGTPQPLLGVLERVDFVPDVVDLAPGDAMVCVTDGVTERRGEAGMLGEAGLLRRLAGGAKLSAQALATKLQREVLAYGEEAPRDDLAILVLRAT